LRGKLGVSTWLRKSKATMLLVCRLLATLAVGVDGVVLVLVLLKD
jgi:hypothetical protein